jgi:hypothetical protein
LGALTNALMVVAVVVGLEVEAARAVGAGSGGRSRTVVAKIVEHDSMTDP